MSDQRDAFHATPQGTPADDSLHEQTVDRRSLPRFAARAKATLLHQSDAMRLGVPADLHDLSPGGLGLNVPESPPELEDIIEVQLENEIQRFSRKVRGVVRHVTPLPEGGYRVGIELLTRMTPLEVSLLKLSPIGNENDDGSVWI